jgi:organic hydroperoxide reductase OsmC/OhrA
MKMLYVYQLRAKWVDDLRGRLECDSNAFDFSVPPDFHGPEGYFSPEDLFVAAVVTCMCTTFWNTLKKMRVRLNECEATGTATLEPNSEGFHFTKVVVELRAKVGDCRMQEQARKALENAQKRCFVSRAVKGNVDVEVRADIS